MKRAILGYSKVTSVLPYSKGGDLSSAYHLPLAALREIKTYTQISMGRKCIENIWIIHGNDWEGYCLLCVCS